VPFIFICLVCTDPSAAEMMELLLLRKQIMVDVSIRRLG